MALYKIATWNVNSIRARLPHVLKWLEEKQPDLLALQETKVIDADFPHTPIEAIGYQVVYTGEKSYNGVALISKQPITDVITQPPMFSESSHSFQRRIIAGTVDGIRIVNLYIPNGSDLSSDKYHYKLNWLEKITEFLQEELTHYPSMVVVGDFNIAPTDHDVYDPSVWKNRVLVSEPERTAFQQLLALGFVDSFRQFKLADDQCRFSWWDYRTAAFRRNHGLRIDLILSSFALVDRLQACVIDPEPRAWERPSDHTPVILSLS